MADEHEDRAGDAGRDDRGDGGRTGSDGGRPADDGRAYVVRARGHEHVAGAHESTFEVTSDDWLTPAGDCILGVEADAVPADAPPTFVEACRDRDATITATFEAAGRVQTVTGRGHPDLTFAGDRSWVGRTSDYVDDRTVMVEADAAAADFDRDLVAALAAGADLTITFRVD